jgi:tRNA nucleotidyltransferase (CCA-adding enzyme)
MNMFRISIPSKIKSALDRLHEAGYSAYFVGGCVRDALLGKEPHDWDIATSAIPKEIKRVFNEYQQIDTGLKHGTVIVVIDNELIEITTYRVDDKYSDGRRPDNVSFTTSIIEDLSRRDFSINACAASDTLLIDPFGAQKDVSDKLIRCVGNPTQRFTEDALRILRGIRFASVLNFQVEEKTKLAMLKCKRLLKNVSQERITVEFCEMLLGTNVKNTLLEFKNILVYIIPEITEMIGFEQHNPYHIYDVYEHSLKTVESIDSNFILRVTMFFHDIGKQSCCSIDQKGIGHYYGHAEISAQMTEKILQRMRFSKGDIRDITELIKYHDTTMEITTASVKRMLSLLGEVQFRRLLKVKRSDRMAQNISLISEQFKYIEAIEQILNDIIYRKECFSFQDMKINGNDLICYGIPEGKQIGVILNKLLEMIIDERVENNKVALLGKVKSMLNK